ncbi:hypothetical protein BKA70DRAFT_1400501 [Coprinopsis sp. MPI-PUGE-AT-0042]|nr:hypothetical protein BKA70DRAFT_1400501 [Coprinopsis sp. MPI-PUGE-AT-0042]
MWEFLPTIVLHPTILTFLETVNDQDNVYTSATSFLDANTNVKVGDFGLEAPIENTREREEMICGTPNYIAPEVLFDTANGHSFEVDIWTIGAILYALVVGRPPFQTKKVKDIYNTQPDKPSSLQTYPNVPNSAGSSTPSSSPKAPSHPSSPPLHTMHPPAFRHITRGASDTNLRRLRRSVLLNMEFGNPEQQARDIAAHVHGHLRAQEDKTRVQLGSLQRTLANIETSVAQQEKEFRKAVQPGSPVSVLLSSARQPLLVGPTATGYGAGGVREIEEVEVDSEMGNRRPSGSRQNTLGRTAGSSSVARVYDSAKDGVEVGLEEEAEEGESQEYASGEEGDADVQEEAPRRGCEPLKPVAKLVSSREKEVMERERERDEAEARERVAKEHENCCSTESRTGTSQGQGESSSSKPAVDDAVAGRSEALKLNGFDTASQILTLAFDARAVGKVFKSPVRENVPKERVFSVRCDKYGMGYTLTDGSVGVHFNESSDLDSGVERRQETP